MPVQPRVGVQEHTTSFRSQAGAAVQPCIHVWHWRLYCSGLQVVHCNTAIAHSLPVAARMTRGGPNWSIVSDGWIAKTVGFTGRTVPVLEAQGQPDWHKHGGTSLITPQPSLARLQRRPNAHVYRALCFRHACHYNEHKERSNRGITLYYFIHGKTFFSDAPR